MSDKFTEASTASGGLGLWGHVDPAEAIAQLRDHYTRELKTATAVLDEIAAGAVRVYHQYGPWARKDRRLVSGDES